MPSSMRRLQARRRSPPSVAIQQSWQAPIRQKPARGAPLNSVWRSRAPLVSIAVSTATGERLRACGAFIEEGMHLLSGPAAAPQDLPSRPTPGEPGR